MNEELQKQIDELRAKIELLQSSGDSNGISKRMQKIRKQAIEKYYGDWNYFRDTDIQICPKTKTFQDMEYLRVGMERLMNIMFKHGRDIGNSQKTISAAIENESDLKEYEEIADFIVNSMVGKIKELRGRHGVDTGKEESRC